MIYNGHCFLSTENNIHEEAKASFQQVRTQWTDYIMKIVALINPTVGIATKNFIFIMDSTGPMYI